MSVRSIAVCSFLGLLLIPLLGVGSALHAGESPSTPHWYVGVGWGSTSLDEGGIQADFQNQSGLTTTSFSLDDDDNAWRLLGGYQFTKNLGLEFNYMDFNEFDFNGQAGATTFRGDYEIDGVSLSGVGRKYFSSRFFGLAKVGLLRWDSSLQARTSTPSTLGSKDHGSDPTWGIGLGYHLSPRMDLRAEWDRYEVKDEDLSMVSANLIYRFGGPEKQADTGRESDQLREELQQTKQRVEEKQDRIQDLESRLADLQKKVDGASVKKEKEEVVLILPNRVLFPTGQATITEEGRQSLTEVAKTLKDHPNRPIRVEGHTDTVPINTERFPSNWELSAARATNVVKYLVQEHGIDPGRIAAVAHGEHQPRVPNTSPENRRKNRRVEIVILPPESKRSP